MLGCTSSIDDMVIRKKKNLQYHSEKHVGFVNYGKLAQKSLSALKKLYLRKEDQYHGTSLCIYIHCNKKKDPN